MSEGEAETGKQNILIPTTFPESGTDLEKKEWVKLERQRLKAAKGEIAGFWEYLDSQYLDFLIKETEIKDHGIRAASHVYQIVLSACEYNYQFAQETNPLIFEEMEKPSARAILPDIIYRIHNHYENEAPDLLPALQEWWKNDWSNSLGLTLATKGDPDDRYNPYNEASLKGLVEKTKNSKDSNG